MKQQDYKDQIKNWSNESIQHAVSVIVNDKENHMDENYKRAVWEVANERWS